MRPSPNDTPDKGLRRRARQARDIGIYTAIPGMLLVGPVLGWLLGHWAGRRWGHAPTFETVGALLGLLAAARQIVLLFRRQAELAEEDKRLDRGDPGDPGDRDDGRQP